MKYSHIYFSHYLRTRNLGLLSWYRKGAHKCLLARVVHTGLAD